jgi:tape measure domain-containing protein
MNVGSVTAYLKLDTSGLSTGVQKAKSEIARFTSDAKRQLDSVGRSLTAGVTTPLLAFGAAAIRAAADTDNLKRGLTAVAGSSAEAERQLVRLKEVAKLPGLGFREAIQGSINLQAAGLNARLAERALMGFGNALATVGKGKAELDGVILALTQIAAKGKVSAEEINQLQERVPQIRQIMKDAFGTADTEVLQKAKIGATEFIEAVVSRAEAAKKSTAGVTVSFENLQDSVNRALSAIGTTFLPHIEKIVDAVAAKLEELAKEWKKLPDSVRNAIGGAAGLAAIIGPLALALSGAIKLVGSLKASIISIVQFAKANPIILSMFIVKGWEETEKRIIDQYQKMFPTAKRLHPGPPSAEPFLKDNAVGPAKIDGKGLAARPMIDAAARAAAAGDAKEAEEERKRTAKLRDEALKQYQVDMKAFQNKFAGMREQATQDFEEKKPLLGPRKASAWLTARLAEIKRDEDAEFKALEESNNRRYEANTRMSQEAAAKLLAARKKESEDSAAFMKRVKETYVQRFTENSLAEIEVREREQSTLQMLAENRKALNDKEIADSQRHLQKLAETREFMARVYDAQREAFRQGLNDNPIGPEQDPEDANRRERFAAIRDSLRSSLGAGFAYDLSSEFGYAFSDGLQKVFGSNPFGRAISRSLSRVFNQFLDKQMDDVINLLSRKKLNGVSGPSSIPGLGGPGGLGGALGSILPMVGIGAALGGLFKGGLKFPHFADGGFVPGRVGMPVPVMAHAGELILNPSQQRAMGGNVTVHFGDVHIQSDADIYDVGRRIARTVQHSLANNPGAG